MKNLFLFLFLVVIMSCNTATEEIEAPVERSIGFNTFLPELKWHLGTEDAIQTVKKIDEFWSKEDYDKMRLYLADTAKFYFADGRYADSPEGFIEFLKKSDEESPDSSWTFDYAYSVDLNPEGGGEHVQAGFTGTEIKDSVKVYTRYHESYYIIEGKVVTWNQFDMDVKKE
jgi:hypothetical protein